MSKQDEHSSVIFLEEFMEFLRHNGFQLGVDTHLKVHQLLENLDSGYPADQLKTLLAPLVVKDSDQQESFYRLFDAYFEKYSERKHALISSDEPKRKSEGESQVGPSGQRLNILSKRKFYWSVQLFILIGIGFLGTQLINCYLKTPSINDPHERLRKTFYCITGIKNEQRTAEKSPLPIPQSNDTVDTNTQADLPKEKDQEAALARQLPINPAQIIPEDISDLEAKWYHKYGMLVKVLLIILVASAYSFYEIFRFYKKKLMIVREKGNSTPKRWKIHTKEQNIKLYTEEEFYETSRKLRAREEGPARDLDLDETINNTISSRGYPNLSYKSGSRPSEYLILIEKHSERDHQAMLFDQLVLEFSQQDIYIERYFFEKDPRLCWKEQYVDDIYLEELHKKYPDNRLIIVGDISAYFNPLRIDLADWTKLLNKWKYVAIVNPQNPLGWGRREVELANHFTLVPATVDAIGQLVEIFQEDKKPSLRYWLDQNRYPLPPSEDDADLIDSLQRYFDTTFSGTRENYQAGQGTGLFNWLCSLAIYPELSWNLTLLMGESFSSKTARIVTPQNLIKMVSLPWFREGYMPDEVREELIEAMDKKKELQARQLIIDALEASPPPVGSAVAAEHYLNLAVQKAHVEANLTNRIKLIRQAQDYALNYEFQDQTVVKELDELPESMLRIKLPQTFKKAVFNRGMISMGVRPWIRAAATTALVALIFLNINPSQLDRVESYAGNDYFLNSKEDRMRFHTYVGNSYLLDSNNFAVARQNYGRALHYKEASGNNYLTPDYNLAVLNLEEGNQGEAIRRFEVVQEQGDSLLAVARTMPTSDSVSEDKKEEARIEEIVARANLNQGYIALREGDREGAENKIKRAEQLLEAKYSLILVQLTAPSASARAQKVIPFNDVLQNVREIYAIDSLFFQRDKDAYEQVNKLLDSLSNIYQNTSSNVYIEEIRSAMRGDTIVVIPLPPSPATGSFTKVGVAAENGISLIRYSDGKFGFLRETDGEVIASGFDFAQPFSQGRAVIKQNTKWGYVDESGRMIITPKYKDARDFVETDYGLKYASVKIGRKWGVIDINGQSIVPFEYDNPIIFSNNDPLAAVFQNGKYGYVDTSGRVVISIKFDEAERFIDGQARVTGRNFKYKSIINKRGEYIVNPPKPERWVAKEERVLYEHKASINDAAFSPSGKLMLTASQDSTANLWRDMGKVLVISLKGHTDWVRSVSFIPNKKISDNQQRILTASKDRTAIIWNQDGSKFRQLNGAKGPLWHAAFSPDGNLVATASEDKVVRVYDIRNSNGRPTEINGHRGTVNCVEFSSTGDSLLSASEDGTVRIWSRSQNWQQIDEFNAGAAALAAHFSPDGRFVVAATKANVAQVWSIATRKLRTLRSHTDWVTDAVFSPNNNYILTTSYDRTAKVFNLEDGVPILNIAKHRNAVQSGAFSPDSKYVITASWDRTLRVWAVEPW